MDIYAASEKPIEGVTAEALVERIRQFGHRGVEYVGTIDRGVEALAERGAGGRPGADAGRRQRVAGRRQAAGEAANGREARTDDGAGSKKNRRRRLASWRLWLRLAAWCAVGVSTGDGGAARCIATCSPIRSSCSPAISSDALDHRRPALRLARQGAARLRRTISAAASSAVPLDERRRRLLAIDWVEDASVSRIWPDRLAGAHHGAQAGGLRATFRGRSRRC